MGVLTTAVKNKALLAMADGLEENVDTLMVANEKDLEAFDESGGRDNIQVAGRQGGTAEQCPIVLCVPVRLAIRLQDRAAPFVEMGPVNADLNLV